MRILSLPSRHPYVSKFHDKNGIVFINPNTDLFLDVKEYGVEYIRKNYPPGNYDIVHIHFSFDILSLKQFEELLKYFKNNHKPIVWTSHSIESQRTKNLGRGKFQYLLFSYANQIISPTRGCADWLTSKFGNHRQKIEIIPLGYMASPEDVAKLERNIQKDRKLFTYLIGDFRENKEYINSIKEFLKFEKLFSTKLQLIFKPIEIASNISKDFEKRGKEFIDILQNSRIQIISQPLISNETIISAFIASHAIILPYKWGTHSGQIELAKDCGCHVVASDVGFLKEQDDKTIFYKVENYSKEEYQRALLEVFTRLPLQPLGNKRDEEFREILREHLRVYKFLVS